MASRAARSFSVLPLLVFLSACSGSDEGDGEQRTECTAPEEEVERRCVDPLRRYEPPDQLDVNNVVSYGDVELTASLPDPPRSGFRLIVPPRDLAPGEGWRPATPGSFRS